ICLDINDRPKVNVTDEQAKKIINRVSGCKSVAEFQQLDTARRNACLNRTQGTVLCVNPKLAITYYYIHPLHFE
ncbi:MAG: hypothetical protein IKV52_01185, partial [Oscillospiraceae bacterium]|nr:hypothetical protein [Oscillospiraceae bacterium]